MIVIGIIFIIAGLAGYFYSLHEMNTFHYSIQATGNFFGITDNSTLELINRGSIIVGVLGGILLLIGIIKMIKD